MSEIIFLDILAQLEKDTREGQNHAVLTQLRWVVTKAIPRPLIVSFADIAYRTNQFILALKFLNPIIRPKTPLTIPPTVTENIIYATSLLHLGAVEEANDLLKNLDPTKDPEIYLHRAFANFAEWKYAAAVPLLQKFINSPQLPNYRRLVGMVNLSAAYVFSGQFSLAEKLLAKTRYLLEQQGHQLLFGNSLELTAQLYLLKKDYAMAKDYLHQSEKVLSATPGRYLFYVKKGHALVEVMKSGGSAESLKTLNSLREEATAIKQWETLRDCDLFQSLATNDLQLSQKVLLGTPHDFYKKRVQSLFEKKLEPPKNFQLDLKSDVNPSSEKPILVELAQFTKGSHSNLAARPKLYQLLRILTSDFYKPPRLGFIFSRLYPDEKFDALSSPHRIFNGVHHLNQWLKENKLPLKIMVQSGEFHLKPLANVTLSITKSLQKTTKNQFDLTNLHQFTGSRTFNTDSALKALKVSKPTLLKVIKIGIASKKIQQIGSGRSTLYKFVKIGKAA